MPTTLEAPPSPPDVFHDYGGDGRGKPPWQLWVALLIGAVSAVYLSWLALRAFRWQPVATTASIMWSFVCVTIVNRRFYISDDTRMMRIALWSLLGGFIAEALQILVWKQFSIGIFWITIGILGIGGGFGIGSMALVGIWSITISVAKLLLGWRAA